MLHQNPEHGPILLSWMLMNFQLIELEANNPEFRKFQQYGTKAAQLGVFSYLQKVITHPMFRDQSPAATIAYQTVYKVLATLCDIFDSDRAVVQHKNIFELLCELLKHPVIAAKFLSSTEDGAQALFQTAIDNFPVDFVPLSMIACSLTATSNDSEIDVSSAVSSMNKIKICLVQNCNKFPLFFRSESESRSCQHTWNTTIRSECHYD